MHIACSAVAHAHAKKTPVSFMRLGGCLLPSSTGNLEGQGQLFVWSLSLSHYSRVLFNSRVWPTKIEQPFWFWQLWNKTSHMWGVFGSQYPNYVWWPFYKLRSQNPILLKVELAALVLLTEKMYWKDHLAFYWPSCPYFDTGCHWNLG